MNIEVIGKICHTFCKKEYPQRENFFKTFAMPVIEPIYHLLTTENDH